MQPIKVRYGATVKTSISLKDSGMTEATIYVGQVGQSPVITKTATFVDGVAYLNLDSVDTKIPLTSRTVNYKYQINVSYDDGSLDKYPDPEESDDSDVALPDFIVFEALDETEVV